MIQPAQYRRLALMALLLAVAFAGLGYRLVDLQVVRHMDLSRKAAEVRESTIIHPPRRGDIFDARGNVLATSLFVKTVCADPSLMMSQQAVVARVLSPLLKMNEADLLEKLQPRTWKDQNGKERVDKYVRLKRQVPLEVWEKIQTAMKDLPFGMDETTLTRATRMNCRNLRLNAIYTEPVDDQLRVYPNGTLAAHLLGFVGEKNINVDGHTLSDLVGLAGIEATFNSALDGVAGWRQTEKDSSRHELVVFRAEDIAAHPGLNVALTLDSGVQNIVESELAKGFEKNTPISISALVIRPKTGAVLAMATLPNFDPNRPGSVGTNIANLRNRVVSDMAEPGSTFKTVVVSAALNVHAVSLNEVFYCENGLFHFAGYPLHDAGHHFGNLTVEDIVAKSSNIGAAKIGMQLGTDRLYRSIRDFGFGQLTGIQLPGEAPGILHPVKDWYKISIAQIPMGQGIAVTPLQMTMAVCAIANHGRLMRPLVVDHLEDENRKIAFQYEPQTVRQVISAEASRQIVQAMKKVTVTGGTAPNAGLEHYTVAGKTGTGQKPPYGSHKYFASFIGFFPADNPELCIAVFLDEPNLKSYYGGETAGPVFKRIAERTAVYLGVPPETEPTLEQPDRNERLAESGSGLLTQGH